MEAKDTVVQDHELEEHEESSWKFGISREIWEEIDAELHSLLKNLLSNFDKMMHIERSIGEKPNDPEDKTAISKWLEKLLNFHQRDSEEDEDYAPRGLDVSKDDEVLKLDRFKIKPLNAGSGGVVKEEKKK